MHSADWRAPQFGEGAIVAAHRLRDDGLLGRIFEPIAQVTRPAARHSSACRKSYRKTPFLLLFSMQSSNYEYGY